MNFDFWRGKRVLVTGHTGFKGSWLSLWLQTLGAQVVGFALDPPASKNLFTDANVAAGMTDTRGDIRDLKSVQHVVDQHKPEIVLHLAAQALVRDSYDCPVETYATNVMGTIHVLEAIRGCQETRAAVVVTTDKCYENKEWPWGYREDDPMGGHDPYSSSKGCAEIATSAYRRSFFQNNVGIATARAGNVIGGGDWAKDRLVPDMVRGLIDHGEFLIRNPAATRPWQHVLEPLGGYMLLAERLWDSPAKYSQGWNFGPLPDDAKPVAEIADLMIRAWGSGTWINGQKPGEVHEANLLQLDCSKARHQLDWTPKLGIVDALQLTTDWYRRSSHGERAKGLSLEQINHYQSIISLSQSTPTLKSAAPTLKSAA